MVRSHTITSFLVDRNNYPNYVITNSITTDISLYMILCTQKIRNLSKVWVVARISCYP